MTTSGVTCPVCRAAVGFGDGKLRQHLCNTHIHYHRYICPRCPATRFAVREDARAHAELEAHPAPLRLVEEPDMDAEASLCGLYAQAYAPFLPGGLDPVTPEPVFHIPKPTLTKAPPTPHRRRAPPSLEEDEEEAEEEPPGSGAEDAVVSSGGRRKRRLAASAAAEDSESSECKMCGRASASRSRWSHVASHIPRQHYGIVCAHCPPETAQRAAWFASTLKGHTAALHPGQELATRDERAPHREAVMEIFFRCFGYYPNARRGPSDVGAAVSEDEAPADSAVSAEEEEPEPEAKSRRSARNFVQHGRVPCGECGETVTNKKEHIAARHLSRAALVCKLCPDGDGMGGWGPAVVKKHFSTQHPDVDVSKGDYDDHRGVLRAEMNQLLGACFAGPKKVVMHVF